MKLVDIFKKLGIKLDEDVDLAETDTLEVLKDNNLNNVVVDKEEITTDVKETKETVEVKNEKSNEEDRQMKLPKYDKTTGLFDIREVEDEGLRAVLKEANDTVKSNNNKALINKAVSDKLSSLKLSKGISPELVNGALNRTGIKVEDGKVVGVDEAFAELQKNNSGLFVTENKPASNPMLEGFNPQVRASGNNVPNSFAEARAMQIGV